MIRTYLAVATMVIYIFLNTLFFLPLLLILDEKKGVALTKFVKKNYGRFVIWLINAKVDIEYKDYKAFEEISKKEPLVVVANHQSFVDIPLILGYLDINIGFVAKKEIKKWYLFNLWMDRAQCIFLDRSSPVTIKGTYEIMNKNKFYIKRGRSIKLIVGRPIDIKELDKDELKGINSKVREEIVNNLKSV